MHPHLKQVRAIALCICFTICGLAIGLSAHAQGVPVPEKKPEITIIVPAPAEKPEALIESTHEKAPDTADIVETEAEAEAEEASDSFNIIDFTASLLDFYGPPVPEKKPEIVPPPLSPLEKLVSAAREFDDQAPLSRKDAQLYALVFEAQQAEDFEAADAVIKDIKDPRLIGHVLYQRYLHPQSGTSHFEELRDWLEVFSDHPGAERIFTLALARKPGAYNGPLKEPQKSAGITRTYEPSLRAGRRYISSRKRTDDQVHTLNALNKDIYALVRKSQPEAALKKLTASASVLDSVEYDLLQGEIASGYLYQGDLKKAQELAGKSIKRSGLHVPKAGWVVGLVAWRNKNYTRAARAFEIVGRSPYASGWTLTAGAYWAARSHMRMGNVKEVSMWLKRGATQPRTFYGLLSTRALGRDFDFNWNIPAFTKDYLDVLANIPAGNRAIALVMAGQPHLAEAELVRISPESDEERTALLAYAGYANLPGLALRVASDVSGDKSAIYDAALYPTGPWQSDEDFNIDPALVYAIMRQESRFDPRAKSPSGARGLMQILPSTARAIADDESAQLDHPATNLELGQRYLEDLLNTKAVDGDLFALLIAYNAGPGNLAKWQKRWEDVKDPLLFIEVIPSSETRGYVERVLSNYWIYRLREGQDTPTLDASAAGRPAIYNATTL